MRRIHSSFYRPLLLLVHTLHLFLHLLDAAYQIVDLRLILGIIFGSTRVIVARSRRRFGLVRQLGFRV